MDRLLFGISGIPLGNGEKFNYATGIEYLHDIGLDAMEFPFVRSVNITNRNRQSIMDMKDRYNFYVSAHGSYYINLNAEEEEKVYKSKERILKGAEALASVGGKSLVFHAGYYLKSTKEEALRKIKEELKTLPDDIVTFRLETTGKSSQFGNVKELVDIAKKVTSCNICIDFSHIHARGGGILKEYKDFAYILEYVGEHLGNESLKDLHIHLSGINYTNKGERNHLPLEESDFNIKACLKAFVDYKIKGCIICESPILERDALYMKNLYNSL